MVNIKTVGIVGAGKLGVTIAQLALSAGYQVYIAGSGDAKKIALSTKIITPGAIAASTKEVIDKADIVILALPLGKFKNLDPQLFKGKLVIDGMNHWFEVDGPLGDIIPNGLSTTEMVQQRLSDARVVKALNHMGYHHLRDEAKPRGATGRKSIAMAGDNETHLQVVARFVDSLGFDPLKIGRLQDGRALEAGQPAFGASESKQQLQKMILNK